MPRLRSLMSGKQSKVGHFSDDAETLEFVGSAQFEKLAAVGTSCPDHFLRTKIAPLTLDPAKLDDAEYLSHAVSGYRDRYAAYYQRCAGPNDPPMRDANPVVVLVPGVGRLTFAADKTTARLAGEFYGNAINVMRGAEAIGNYIGLDEREAFNIEYWALEEAKLQRMPRPKPLAGKIALITGAAGGIGAASAQRLLSDGACVMLTDRDEHALQGVGAGLATQYGKDFVRTVLCDVTDEAQVQAAFAACAREFGGLDILVANAGLASAAAIEETTMALWRKNYDVLVEGYFLTARAAFPLLKQQKAGAIVFIGSKNALAATPNASAYASAKAAAVHLARCLALEGAEHGIRVNVVNPGRRDPRLADLGRRVATRARRRVRCRSWRGARGVLPQALHAEAERAAAGRSGGGLVLRVGDLGVNRPATFSTWTPATRRRLLADLRLSPRAGDLGMPAFSEIATGLGEHAIELPSWAFGNSGTRFKVFAQPGVPRNPFEKIADAAQVHKHTGLAPSVALHIPWDQVDSYGALRKHAAGARRRASARSTRILSKTTTTSSAASRTRTQESDRRRSTIISRASTSWARPARAI